MNASKVETLQMEFSISLQRQKLPSSLAVTEKLYRSTGKVLQIIYSVSE